MHRRMVLVQWLSLNGTWRRRVHECMSYKLFVSCIPHEGAVCIGICRSRFIVHTATVRKVHHFHTRMHYNHPDTYQSFCSTRTLRTYTVHT